MKRPDQSFGEQVLIFGPFRLLLTRRMLMEGDRPVRIGGRALEILLALVERAGELVDKDELIARAWPHVVVEEATIRVHVAALRKLLGNGQRGARYIENVVGRGYRFVAPVTRPEADEPLASPPNAATGPRHNLPAPAARMIGRAETIAKLAVRLPRQRFITIVGPGGIGKTAVALAVADQLSGSHGYDACFVDLESVPDPQLVSSALASALGLAMMSPDPLAGLIAFLGAKKKSLIVLDNCEHVVEAAAALAEKVLAVPGVLVLATSREPLRAETERVHRLSPLQAPPASAELSVAEALAFPAIQLFAERAMASLDTFELKDADVQMVSDLCRRLDGIPLAIELVAARVELLGIRGLFDQLDGMHRLTNSRHEAPPRHRTLCATLDWSYGLLSGKEQLLLRRFAIFAGGFDLASARAIASDRDISATGVFDGILSLAAKSLITADVSDEDVIYRLLDTTRAYAREKLAGSSESNEISRRHATFLCGVWDEARDRAQSDAQWLEKHARRIDDIRSAIDWCFSPGGDILLGQRLTAASGPLWFGLHLSNEYGLRLQRALQARHAGFMSDAALEMQLALALGSALLLSGGPGAAAAFNRVIDIADRLGDTATLCDALFGLAFQRVLAGDYTSAVRASERAYRHIDKLAEERAALSERMIALTYHYAGRQTIARGHAERALQRGIGGRSAAAVRAQWLDHGVTARAIYFRILWIQGFADQAAIRAHECIEDAVSPGHGLSLNFALLHACTVVLWAGDMPAADRFVAMLRDHSDRHSLVRGKFWARSFAAVLDLRRGKTKAEAARRAEILSDPLCDRPHLETLGTLSEALLSEEAIVRARGRRAGWCNAEILRADAATMLKSGARDAAVAESCFRRALDIARRQGALSWELRAATSLARLWQDHDRVGEAHDLLASVYGRFTEGFETADLVAARALLNALASY